MRIKCFECNRAAENNHHVVPKSRGGTRTVPLCGRCHDLVHSVGIIELSQRSWKATKKAGKRYGNIPYGYKQGKTSLIKCRKEQAILRAMHRLKDKGLSWQEIADKLAAKGIKTRQGNPVNWSFVQNKFRSKKQNDRPKRRRPK